MSANQGDLSSDIIPAGKMAALSALMGQRAINGGGPPPSLDYWTTTTTRHSNVAPTPPPLHVPPQVTANIGHPLVRALGSGMNKRTWMPYGRAASGVITAALVNGENEVLVPPTESYRILTSKRCTNTQLRMAATATAAASPSMTPPLRMTGYSNCPDPFPLCSSMHGVSII